MFKRTLMTSVLALGLIAFGASAGRADGLLQNFCSDNIPVSANGSFNIDETCPAGQIVTGGYSCSYNAGANLLPVIVSVNTFFGYPVANGWQTIGQTLASAQTTGHTYACVNSSSGTVKIVASCTVGSNASPCHNHDVCTDLSGQGVQPVITNPTCQVCISCIGAPG